MFLCLVVQKDTLENNKVKSVLKTTEDPKKCLEELQQGHCIEYQLVASVPVSSELNEKAVSLTNPFKTSYGKDWYSFDHEALGNILSLFLKYDCCSLDLKAVSGIYGFSLSLFPVITKEIVVSPVNKVSSEKEDIATLLESLQAGEKSELRRKKDKKSK